MNQFFLNFLKLFLGLTINKSVCFTAYLAFQINFGYAFR